MLNYDYSKNCLLCSQICPFTHFKMFKTRSFPGGLCPRDPNRGADPGPRLGPRRPPLGNSWPISRCHSNFWLTEMYFSHLTPCSYETLGRIPIMRRFMPEVNFQVHFCKKKNICWHLQWNLDWSFLESKWNMDKF